MQCRIHRAKRDMRGFYCVHINIFGDKACSAYTCIRETHTLDACAFISASTNSTSNSTHMLETPYSACTRN